MGRPSARRWTAPSRRCRSSPAGPAETHDYKRNGTIDLFAAMNIATGKVLTGFQKRHAGVDVLKFFKQIDATVPRRLAVHVVLDNLSAHSGPRSPSGWPTATGADGICTSPRPQARGRIWWNGGSRNSPTNVFVVDASPASPTSPTPSPSGPNTWNTDPKPFVWKATAEDIIAKVQRGRDTLHQIESTMDHLATKDR